MIDMLNDESLPIEERLEIVKILLKIKDDEIEQLKSRLNALESNQSWYIDQASCNRMGL